ncbi:MAG: 30S ribosome-binding factor RbfA [Candidatus Berkelbacteria bacterium]
MSRRTAKVEELLREELSKLIQSEISEDFGIISVTRIMVNPDLKTARIFISAVFHDKEKDILQELKKNASSFRYTLSQKFKLRYMPSLTFELDKTSFAVNKVEELLKEIDRGN